MLPFRCEVYFAEERSKCEIECTLRSLFTLADPAFSFGIFACRRRRSRSRRSSADRLSGAREMCVSVPAVLSLWLGKHRSYAINFYCRLSAAFCRHFACIRQPRKEPLRHAFIYSISQRPLFSLGVSRLRSDHFHSRATGRERHANRNGRAESGDSRPVTVVEAFRDAIIGSLQSVQ